MTKKRNDLSRRDFLKTSAAVGGGSSGRVAERPVLTDRGHGVSDGFDVAYDPHNQCVQAGLVRHLTTPYPMKIEQYPDRVLLIYEEWEIVRTVYLDSEPPADLGLSAIGYSVGDYEDELLGFGCELRERPTPAAPE